VGQAHRNRIPFYIQPAVVVTRLPDRRYRAKVRSPSSDRETPQVIAGAGNAASQRKRKNKSKLEFLCVAQWFFAINFPLSVEKVTIPRDMRREIG
jgi:hypothetical protein